MEVEVEEEVVEGLEFEFYDVEEKEYVVEYEVGVEEISFILDEELF